MVSLSGFMLYFQCHSPILPLSVEALVRLMWCLAAVSLPSLVNSFSGKYSKQNRINSPVGTQRTDGI